MVTIIKRMAGEAERAEQRLAVVSEIVSRTALLQHHKREAIDFFTEIRDIRWGSAEVLPTLAASEFAQFLDRVHPKPGFLA